MLHRRQITRISQIGGPIWISTTSSQNLLGQSSPPPRDRFDVRNSLPMTDDRESLPVVLDGIEQIGELASSVSCGYIWHEIILSDSLVSMSCHHLTGDLEDEAKHLANLHQSSRPYVAPRCFNPTGGNRTNVLALRARGALDSTAPLDVRPYGITLTDVTFLSRELLLLM